jgi:hypothetical protein
MRLSMAWPTNHAVEHIQHYGKVADPQMGDIADPLLVGSVCIEDQMLNMPVFACLKAYFTLPRYMPCFKPYQAAGLIALKRAACLNSITPLSLLIAPL